MKNAHIAQIIKNTCKSKNVSITKLLNECSIRKSLIYDLEKRDYTPSVAIIEQIADYLDVSVDYLLGREENPEKKYDATINQAAEAFSKLSFSDKAKVMNLIAELSEKNDE